MARIAISFCLTVSVFLLIPACDGSKKSATAGPSPAIDPAATVTPPPYRLPLNVTIDSTDTKFRIHNHSDFAWTNCTFSLNEKSGGGGYYVQIATVSAKKWIVLEAMQFANDGGKRFNPFTHKATELNMQCDTPDGRASGGFQYEDDAQSEDR